MRANISSLTVGTVNAGTISTVNLSASNLSAATLSATTLLALDATISSISTTSITLDGNTLDTGGGGFGATLLLNGVAIATTANISSIADWAYFPAISTIDCDQRDIVDCKDIFATNLTATNSIAGVIGGFTTLNSGSIVNSGSILTNTLQTTGLINAASISTPSLRANLISSGTVLGSSGTFSTVNANTISTASLTAGVIGVSSLTATTAFFSTLQVSSIVLPPSEEVSSITIDNLTVNVSANFSGTRPNFTTGINSSGPNNFNNNNLDNCGQINAGALNLLGSATVGITANAGGSILTNNSINLATSNGGSSVINIEAKRNALAAYPIPLSQVNITAEGNCPNLPVVPLTPYGGEISLIAYQGPDPIFPLTPLTNAFAPGAIHLTAYSKGVFPGLITEAAGSILAYSGLTNPTTGLYGCSFYSALTCLSLTAGLSPALTSFPGTVYLRGDNGTKVLNGLYIDHLYNAAGYTLAISATGGCNVTIDDCAYIGMTTNPVIDGGSVNGRIRNFSTISALNLLVSNISTGTTSVDQIYTRNINIDPPSTVYISHPDLTINANLTTDEAEDPQPNNLNLYASSNINIQCGNNPSAFSVNITGDTYVSRTFTASLGISTTNINLSTINGAAYTPGGGGGGGWVSTATTQLFMNDFPINLRNTSTVGLAYGSAAPYSVGVDGPYLFGNTQGALGTVSPANDISLAWDTNKVEIYKTLDMNNNNISSVSTTISFQGGGLIKDYDVGIHLFDIDGNGAAQTRLKNGSADVVLLPAGDIYFAGVLHSQNDLDMMSHNITAVSSITSAGELSISATTDIKTSAVSTINSVSETVFTGGVSRQLVSDIIAQPIIQYGQVSSSGSSGAVTVTMPTRYTSVSSYLPFACMADAPAAEVYVSTLSRATFEIGWQNGGGGAQLFNWNTMGT